MALMTYLLKDRHGTYYFRKVIPAALRPFMPAPWQGKANFKRTLGTKRPEVAKVEASKALRDCTIAFQSAKQAMRGTSLAAPSSSDIATLSAADIEQDAIAEVLAADEAQREDGDDRRHFQTEEERLTQWPLLTPVEFGRKGMAEDQAYAYGLHLSEMADEYRDALARRDPRIIDAELGEYLRKRGLPVDPSSDAYRAWGLAMLRGHVRAYGLLLDRQAGKIVDPPKPSSGRGGPKLSEAFAAWKAGGSTRGEKQPSASAAREAAHAVRRFLEWHGDLRLGDIDKAKSREFRDALAKVPTRLPRKMLRLTLKDLLKLDLSALPSVHANTINKSVQLLSAIVSHAMRRGDLDELVNYSNPFQNIKLEIDVRTQESRAIFEAGDLKAIFSTGIYSDGVRPRGGGGEAAFWLPLIALLTGARQNELAQLRIMDLKQDEETGVWFFDIGTSGGRAIKTESSRRKVPLHSHLLTVGLLRYRQSLIDAGAALDASLWPDIKSRVAGRQVGPWAKWFSRYLREEAQVSDPGKVFHSFRHSFKRLARDARLTEEFHDALTGHTGGGVGRTYGSGFGLAALSRELNRIEVPAAVADLKWKKGKATDHP